MNNPKIGILGCGWLGLPLAIHFVKNGFEVHGSTTSPDKIDVLRKNSVQAHLLSFIPHPSTSDYSALFDVEILIINIPPSIRKNPKGFHLEQVQNIDSLIRKSSLKKVIFISSTSVYPDSGDWVDESEDLSFHDHELLKAENILKANQRIRLNILRCGGLMGYNRIPGKYFAGKKALPEGDNPVNYVHRDDVIGIIQELILKDIWGHIFNIVAPKHPLKKEVAIQTSKDFNFEIPEFLTGDKGNFKIVSGEKIVDLLNYSFKYPDPREFFYKME